MINVRGDMFQIAKAMTAGGRTVAIGHGCNRYGVMGAGVAKLVSAKFPSAHELYRQACYADLYDVGTNQYIDVGDHTWLVNMFTQDKPGPDARIEALEHCLADFFVTFKQVPLVVPEIGAGIGGLDRDEVFEVFKPYDDRLVVVSYA